MKAPRVATRQPTDPPRPTRPPVPQILELEPGASDSQIRRAYRKMSLKYHPDKTQGALLRAGPARRPFRALAAP